MMLYLLRQRPGQISSSLFHAPESDMTVISLESIAAMSGFSYDDLIEKIFSSEQVIVI